MYSHTNNKFEFIVYVGDEIKLVTEDADKAWDLYYSLPKGDRPSNFRRLDKVETLKSDINDLKKNTKN